MAAKGPAGTQITQVFEDRLSPPDDKELKNLPTPKEGESYFIVLHPGYLEKSKFNTVSVDQNSEDYRELKKSIELNGVKDPVLTRINPDGGLEILSGQRRHMIARELNYPVPAIIQKIDDADAKILVSDGNLHRPKISTYDLSRTLRMKMEGMKQKAGRRKKGFTAEELNSDEKLAKEMGMSVSKLNRIIRLSEASKEVCNRVDDGTLPLSAASALSFLKPENQDVALHLTDLGYKLPTERIEYLKKVEKAGKLDEMTMRKVLDGENVLEPPKVSDHILDPKEYHVELFPGNDSTIVLENNRRPNLTIWKRDADSGAPVEGAVFLVKGADGHSVAEVTTGPDGSAKVPNLLPMVYEVIEKSVPSPYLLDADPQLVTLYPNRDRDVYFENHKAPTIEIIKENSITHERLANVRFQVWYASNDTETGEYNDLGVFTTDENGRIELTGPANGLRDGWFRVKELEPPTGFSIKDSDTQEAFIPAGKGHTFLFENTPLSALIVYKQDSVSGEGLSGCRFQLSYLGGETSGSGGTVIGTYTTSANGSFTVTGLKAGYYICEELESDSGHVIDAAPQSFYISGKDQDIVTLYFSNAPKGAVLVKKVSAADNTPLSDVEFLVTKSDGSVVGDANGKFVTDSTGTFLVEGVEPGTTLVIKETRAKPGYLLDDTPQTVQVKEGQTVTVEFRNQPLGNLIIHKLSSKDKTPLEGVQFKITYADGSYLPDEGGKLSSNGLYWTNSEGQIILSGITGTVVVTEVESIPGYTIDPNTQSQTVVVNPDDTQQLYFYNAPVGGVEFTKVNEADKTETISGVTFEIRRVSDDALVDTVTTGKDGKVFLPLEADNYYAVETDCPDTFKLDPTPIYFTVKDGETTRKTVTNKAFSGILLHKIDAATRKGIYGVTFLLYDGNMNPVDQFTTDQNGYAYIDTLELSGKVYLRELENEGYIVDEQLKTVYIKPGETTEITWENRAITGQIQIIKKSADDNPINGLPAGTLLEGAVFEIYDKAGNVVDTIKSDSRGRAVSKQLPLSRYTIREVASPDYYAINPTVMTAYLEYEGQIVTFEVEDESVATGVNIKKTGPVQVVPGQPIQYSISGIGNTSTVQLQSFYWRDTLPGQVTLTRIVTGTYNQQLSYKIVYKTNLSGDTYRTLADNLSTTKNYVLDASPTALGLAANEKVTEFMVVFGVVKAGFAQVETPYINGTVSKGLANGSSFVNVADIGGLYNGQWIMGVSRWVTSVYVKTTVTLPRTGY